MAVIVRHTAEADISAAVAIQAAAFGGALDGWSDAYRRGLAENRQDGWVVESDGEVGAAAFAFRRPWWMAGVKFQVDAIAGVAVGATYRRRGFASEMMRAILNDAYAREAPLSLLYPFQSGFYRRLGYGTVGLTHFYRIPLQQLPDDRELRLRVRALRDDDQPVIEQLYHAALPRTGGFERSTARWQELRRFSNVRSVVYDDGAVRGYAAYQRIEHQLDIHELVATTAEAERGLWAFVAAQIEEADAATYHAPVDQPLWALLREPLMAGGQSRGGDMRDAAIVTAGLMGRVVHLAAACTLRPTSATGDLTLRLADPVIAANNGTFRLGFADGRITAAPSDDPAQATCDIVTFSQLFSGVLKASAARYLGQLQADDAAVALLEQAFPGPPPFVHPADMF